MANPQKENGYTAISNEIMEALCRIRIPGEERQVMDCILRKTYGWNKCEDSISLTQFMEMTGLKKPAVCRAINGLLSKKIIAIIEKDNEPAKLYKFIKDYHQWKPLSKKITLSKKIIKIIKKDNLSLSKKSTTKTIIKDTITKDNAQVPDWVNLEMFLKYQQSRHKKLKSTSFELFFKKLKRLSTQSNAPPEEILKQSIENGWEGIFLLKGDNNANTNQGFQANSYRKNNHDRPSSLSADDNAELERISAEYYAAKKKAAVHPAD